MLGLEPIGLVPLGLALLNLYALVLVLARAWVFRTRLYRPMVLNLALSVAPVVVLVATFVTLLVVVTVAPSRGAVFAVVGVGGLVWLLLLPNAAYLLTELNFSHRREDDPVPLWYDIVLVLTLAVSGVLNALTNVVLAQLMYVAVVRPNAAAPFDAPDSWVMAGLTLLLVSFGIYLGRYVRFNSWDLLHPASFVRKLVRHVREPGRARTIVAFCVMHTALFAFLYLVVVAPVVLLVTQ